MFLHEKSMQAIWQHVLCMCLISSLGSQIAETLLPLTWSTTNSHPQIQVHSTRSLFWLVHHVWIGSCTAFLYLPDCELVPICQEEGRNTQGSLAHRDTTYVSLAETLNFLPCFGAPLTPGMWVYEKTACFTEQVVQS